MKSLKGFLVESGLYGNAIKPKPQKYVGEFLSKWKDPANVFDTTDGGTISLKYDDTQANILKKALDNDALVGDELTKYLKDSGKWEIDRHGTPMVTGVKNGQDIKVSLNKIEKANITGRKEPTGAQWESLISIAVNLIDSGASAGPPLPSLDPKDAKKYGIDTETFAKVKKFWGSYGANAMKLGQTFITNGYGAPMKQTGADSVVLNKLWTDWGGTNKTPKTDMTALGGKVKISLKKSGGSQLMSAKKGEAKATFHAAMQLMSANPKQKKYIDWVINEIESNFQTIVMAGAIGDLTKKPTPSWVKNLTPDELSSYKKKVADQTEINNAMTELMENIFNGTPVPKGGKLQIPKEAKLDTKGAKQFHEEFKKCFVFEAASGLEKFSGSLGTATHLVEFTETGGISKNYSIGKVDDPKNYTIGPKIVTMAQNTNFYVAFKTGKTNPYSALRASVKEDYNPEIPTLRDLVFETLEEDGTIPLIEGYEELNEWALLQRAFDKVSKRASKVGGWVKDKAQGAIDWLKGFVGKLLQKVKKALSAIAKLGKAALHSILTFFGMGISNAAADGDSLIFHKMA